MTKNSSQLDPIEEALLELSAADRASVFRRTRVDAHGLLGSSAPVERTVLRWLAPRFALPAAAAVMVAVGLSGWFLQSQINVQQVAKSAGGPVILASAGPCNGSFATCMTGPGAVGGPGCKTCDFDSDGDVDLADVRAYQLAYAGPSR